MSINLKILMEKNKMKETYFIYQDKKAVERSGIIFKIKIKKIRCHIIRL